MAKNVAITEDGSAKVLNNVEKIKTSIKEGGTCLWVPKDDFPVGVKNVTEDGTYNPADDNLYAYSKVVASGIGNTAMGRLITKSVTKNGTYNITDESGNPYGYSSFTVNVDTSDDSGDGPGDTPITGKDEDGNDAMVQEEDGDLTVTILPTHIKVLIPPKKLDYNRYEEIDYDGIVVYAYISKMPHAIGTTTVEVSEGSTNPVVSIGGQSVTANTGDMILYAPDRTGLNDVQLVWDGEKWIKESEYISEESLWKSKDYPTGKIPFEELIFPFKRVNPSEDCDLKDDIDKANEVYEVKVDSYAFYFSKIQNVYIEDYYEGATGNHPLYVSGYKVSNRNYTYSIQSDDAYFFSSITSDRYIDYGITYASLYIYRNIGNTPSNLPVTITCTKNITEYRTHQSQQQVPDVTDRTEPVNSNVEIEFHDCIVRFNGESNHVSATASFLDKETGLLYDYVIRGPKYFGNEYPPYYNVSIMPLNIISNDIIDLSQTDYINRYPFENAKIKLLNGEYTIRKMMSIPVQWKRPGDGKILETTFIVHMNDDVDAVSGADPVAPQS